MKKVSFPLNVPKEVQLLQAAFQEADQELFLVGGCVRDAVLNKPAKDYDLVTSALPDHVEEILQDFPTKAVGKSFGVILVSVNGQEFEVATFRKDGQYSDGRHPDQVEFSTLEEDAFRRDLTINALYYNLKTQEVWDFHRGLEDLKNKKTKFVGQALDRLKEDKLRALRFVRFHGRLNAGAYHTLDQEAAKAIQQVVLAPDISGERIRDEFLKGLESVLNQQNFLYNLNDLGLLPQIFPDSEMFFYFTINLSISMNAF
jgi:tRNA nucleotidyltransferase/poly(A) polymerase